MSLQNSRVRTFGAQINRMSGLWPEFAAYHLGDEIRWRGALRPLQKEYSVEVQWAPNEFDKPLVRLITPHLIPRDGATYEDIPHLIFCSKQPKDSALCLFDPDGKGWKPTMWIADTTVPWASRWLYYYELWHFDGVWRGGGVGPATIAEIRAREADKASANDGARPRAENG